MFLERGGMSLSQKDMEDTKTNNLEILPTILKPEILSPDQVRILIPHNPEVAHYNAAVIPNYTDSENPNEILILVREVPLAGVKSGIPDKGSLLIYRSTPDLVEEVARLELSHPEISNWEDARAYVFEEVDRQGVKHRKVSIGLTAIRTSDNAPVASTIEGEVVDGKFSINPESLLIYPEDVGKNVTPISANESLFRRNGHCRSLEVVEHGKDEKGQNKLKIKKIIDFPEKSWCQWQIGTQAQMLPGGILPIHGVNRFPLGINPETNKEEFGYTYSLGLAQMDENLENLSLIKISDMPIFTRESFKNILPMGKEMDPNKDVIYCCGYSVVGDTVKFVINIGDLMTVEVSKKLSELQKMLDQSSPVEAEQIQRNATIFQKSA